MSTTAALTDEQIDRFILALRTTPGDHIARGRSGGGYACRDGQFIRITVDEGDTYEYAYPDEAALRAALRALPADPFVSRYERWVMRSLGVE